MRNIIYLLFFFNTLNSFCQELLPYIKNFTKENYDGDNQIWNITQSDDNSMFFANNSFFLRYNGVIWEKYNLPNKMIIRSVFSNNDKIYSGAYNEFGYWKRLKNKMEYFSLSKDIKFINEAKNEEIWKIFKHNDAIYFQSFNNLYIYKNNTINQLKLPFQISYCYVIDNQIYFPSINSGMFILKNNKFERLKEFDILKGQIIHGMFKYKNKTYIFTQKNGIYIYENKILKPLQTTVNELFKKNLINTAQFLDENLIVGTATDGLYIVDLNNFDYININRTNALANNTILSIYKDKEKNLWIGLDNGIARVEMSSKIKFFYDKTGQLGSVYSICKIKDGMLLGSNHGVFKYSNQKLMMLPNSQGHVWDISKIDNTKFVIGHNDGTFIYENEIINKTNNVTGGWKFYKSKFDNSFIQANYTGITIYKDNLLKKFDFSTKFIRPIKDISQISSTEIIAIDNYKGLFYLKYNIKNELIQIKDICKINNISEDYKIKMFSFKNQILIYTANNWYKLDTISLKLTPYSIFNDNFNNIQEITSINENQFAILKANKLYIITSKNQNFYWNYIPEKYYKGKIINENIKISSFDSNYLLNIDDGFISFKNFDNEKSNSSINIEVYSKNKYIEKNKIPHNSIFSLIVIPNLFNNNQQYYYSINNQKRELLIDNTINFYNLSFGDYQISIDTFDGKNFKNIKTDSFYVLAPWYLSTWTILFYFVLLISIIYIYYKWSKIQYLKKIKYNTEKIEHQNEIYKLKLETENQQKSQLVEKQLLEMQVNTKANELAGKSLSIAKQSELIETIQNILDEENTLLSIKSKINKAIKTNVLSKNEWKSFENNLLKSNEIFVNVLTLNFPDLTSKDIKLCVFLKMNLSSKEIAPLMNISYRGVEIHRYRLRKKLNINQEVSINSFLNSIKY